MAFLTALLSGAGGYARGRQQKFENQQAQQRQQQTADYENRQLGIEEQNANLNRQLTQQQIDAAQRQNAQDIASQKFESNLKLPPMWNKMDPDAKTAYLQVRQNAAYRAGDTALAQEVQKQIDGLYGLTKAGIQAQARANLEAFIVANQNMRSANQIAAGITRTGMNNATSIENNQNTVQGADTRNIRTTDTSRDNSIRTTTAANARNAQNVTERYTAQSNNDMRDMERQNAIATRDGKPQPYPNLDGTPDNPGFKPRLAAAIALVSKDPKQLQRVLRSIESQASVYGPQLIIYARRQLENAARDAQQMQGAQLLPPTVKRAPANLPPPPLPPLPR